MEERDYSEYFKENQANWDSRTEIHINSEYYNVEEFIKNPNKLSFLANEHLELGEVSGKRILHLMCHFGLDTLSFARLGAEVTGVDFSSKAIDFAQKLKKKTKLDATFIQSNIYDLPNKLDEKFDIVFTSIGILCWLPDLEKWAEIISHFLKPGGLFFIKDGHPFKNVFEYDAIKGLYLEYPYFSENKAYKWEANGTYTGEKATLENKVNYQWDHTMSSILNSLIKAGLIIESLQEFNFLADQRFPFMEKNDKGQWVLPDQYQNMLPLMFSIKARKPK
ncbi:MAG: class I SAM-dependent methyltransferase [Candidatus Heimdallarchaeaceae archaeon]